MLRVWFGDRDNVIYNTSVYFRNRYKDSWITDEFAKAAIKDIYRSEVLDANTIQSPVLGQIPPDKLSGGVKDLILMKMNQVRRLMHPTVEIIAQNGYWSLVKNRISR